jgi:plastocyanin
MGPGEELFHHLLTEEQIMFVIGSKRRTPACIVLAVLAVALSPSSSPAGIVTVDVFNLDFGVFNPSTGTGTHFDPTISLGDTIRWNFAQGTHNTQSSPGQLESWASPITSAPPGGTFDHTFTHVGDFQYYCVVHTQTDANGFPVPGALMVAFIHVVPEPSLILGISAIGMVIGGWCVRRRRKS